MMKICLIMLADIVTKADNNTAAKVLRDFR